MKQNVSYSLGDSKKRQITKAASTEFSFRLFFLSIYKKKISKQWKLIHRKLKKKFQQLSLWITSFFFSFSGLLFFQVVRLLFLIIILKCIFLQNFIVRRGEKIKIKKENWKKRKKIVKFANFFFRIRTKNFWIFHLFLSSR